MKRDEGDIILAKNNRKFFASVNPRLKITSGLVSTIGVLLAAIVFSSDLSWVYARKPIKVSGIIVRDLNKNGKQNIEDLNMGSVHVRSYRDLNFNSEVDAGDILLDQTYSDASGYFSLDLPYINRVALRSEDFGEKATWTEKESFTFHFARNNVKHIKNIKEIWLEVESKGSYAEFASSDIRVRGHENKVVRWDHKPWKNGKTYRSSDIKSLVKPFLDANNDILDIYLSLQFSEGLLPREISSKVSLNISYDNKEIPFLIAYESGFNEQGIMNTQTYKLGKDLQSIVLPYQGFPAHCLAASENGTYFHFNRFSKNGFPLTLKTSKKYVETPTLLSDPISGMWLTVRNGRMKLLDASSQLIREKELKLPFCLEKNNCTSAYAYHALNDEIWLLDTELNLWRIKINRQENDLEFSTPVHLADWKEFGIKIPNQIKRMVINPEKDQVFFLNKQENGAFHLNMISSNGDNFRPLGPLVYGGNILTDITGFDFRPNGDLWVMNLAREEKAQEIYKVDLDFQLLSLVSSIPVSEEINACACLAPAPFKISTKVFDDKNLNEKIDEGERFLRNVRINALTYNIPAMLPKKLEADAEGNYIFRTYKKGMTTFQIEEESLPEGILSINLSSLIIPHENDMLGIHVEDFNFPVTHISNSPSIRWAGIRGKLQDGGIELEWATAKEEDSKFFEILRSEDGIHYEAIGGIESTGTSNEMQEYQYKDYLIDDLETPIVAYRVKMKGGLGKISFSPVTQIVISEPSDGLDLKVHVHPSNESIRLNYQVLKPGPAELRILNLTGSVLATIPLGLSQNGAEKNIPVKGWAKGMYYAQLRNGENSVMVRWILK